MIKPEFPKNEATRQKEVEKYNLLDTLPEECYDTITALMAHICDVPISLVSILDKDRNFLKSHHGLPFDEDPRERSFCGHAILSDENILVVSDASKDERFHDNPLVAEMGVRFYAGAPLINPNGHKIGTLCVFDTEPKELNEMQIQALINMSKQVMLVMEERFKNILLTEAKTELNRRNDELNKFAHIVAHDLKSPLISISSLIEVLTDCLDGQLNDDAAACLEMLSKSSESLTNYVNGILGYYRSEKLLRHQIAPVNAQQLFNALKDVYAAERDLQIHFNYKIESIRINSGAIHQILVNLISNGIKYNSKENRLITVHLEELTDFFKFKIEDNGDGMDGTEKDKIFELFETNNKLDRSGKVGTGIGLATVKKLIENLEGEIWVESTPKVGTIVIFTIPKFNNSHLVPNS